MRFILGALLSILGGLGGIALIVFAVGHTGGWAFVIVPATIAVGLFGVIWGGRLIARAIDG